MNKKFENFGTALSREQMKKIMGGCGIGELCGDLGDNGGIVGCGTGISCSNKKEGDECGTNSCICEFHHDGLFCTSQV